ncbi:MAG: hypothetical protein COA43_12315 [Robiginitomaculum sp.]|nr:MAG: hypothetical protein COA43_12315 [Robiginitomaculum sp.]
MRRAITTISACISTLLAGCNTLAQTQAVPALVETPSNTNRDVLTKAISQALHNSKVQLSLSDFSKRNTVIIEGKQHMAPNGLPIMGRITKDMMTPADHFQLMKRGKKCFLIHTETGEEYVLKGVTCQAM